jgi:hypothetical protein
MKILNRINKSLVVEIISGLFILLFLYTSLSKLSDIHAFKEILGKSPLIGKFAQLIAWTLPTIEIIVAILLFFPRTRKIGLNLSLVLMIGFTGYLIYMIYATPNLPCSCGGVLSSLTWKEHIVFNILFTLLALLGILLNRSSHIQNRNNSINYTPA